MPNILSLLFKGAVGAGVSGVRATAGAGLFGKAAVGAGIGGIVGAAQGYDINTAIEGAARGALLGGIAGSAVHTLPRATAFAAREGYKGGKFLWSVNREAGARAMMKRARMMELGGRAGPLSREAVRGAESFTGQLAASPAGRLATTTGRAGMAALNHPLAVAGTIGGIGLASMGVGAISITTGAIQPMTSPSLEGEGIMRANYNQQALMAAEMGQIGTGTIGPPAAMAEQFAYGNWMDTVGKSLVRGSRVARFMDSTVGLPQGLHAGRHS